MSSSCCVLSCCVHVRAFCDVCLVVSGLVCLRCLVLRGLVLCCLQLTDSFIVFSSSSTAQVMKLRPAIILITMLQRFTMAALLLTQGCSLPWMMLHPCSVASAAMQEQCACKDFLHAPWPGRWLDSVSFESGSCYEPPNSCQCQGGTKKKSPSQSERKRETLRGTG